MYCILHLYNLPLDSKTYSDTNTKYLDVVSQVIILLVIYL